MNKKVKYKCYFAHPSSFDGSVEEVEIIKELKERGVTICNPFATKIHEENKYRAKTLPYKIARDIWIEDFQSVADCDMLLAYQPYGSAGTGAEILYAYRLHKFIQIISPMRHPLFAYVLTGGNQMFESIKDFKNLRQLRWD